MDSGTALIVRKTPPFSEPPPWRSAGKTPGRPRRKIGLVKSGPAVLSILLAFSIVRGLGSLEGEHQASERSRAYFSQWILDKQIQRAVSHQGLDEWTSRRSAQLVRLLLVWQSWYVPGVPASEQASRFLKEIIHTLETQQFLNVNLYDGKLSFNQENFDEMTWWLLALASIDARPSSGKERAAHITEAYKVILELLAAEAKSGFELDKLA